MEVSADILYAYFYLNEPQWRIIVCVQWRKGVLFVLYHSQSKGRLNSSSI